MRLSRSAASRRADEKPSLLASRILGFAATRAALRRAGRLKHGRDADIVVASTRALADQLAGFSEVLERNGERTARSRSRELQEQT
jgi:hypothetical protein